MAISRRDDWVQDAQGRALAGATVYYVNQPANTSTTPPSPLATTYSDTAGDPGVNPVTTDGFGHAFTYLQAASLYTIVVNHPLFLTPIVLPDQQVGGGSGGTAFTPFEQTPSGSIPGTVYTLPFTPAQANVIVNGITLIPTLGYTQAGGTFTLARALQAGDAIFIRGLR